jgi:rare lipoprotein A
LVSQLFTRQRVARHLWPVVALLLGCPHGPPADLPFVEVGEASFYDASLAGHLTASGAILDLRAFTCAHPTLPFGTRLKVTVLDTGAATVVEVTDRGPFVPGRVVDLTPAAAEALGFHQRGLARVRLEVASSPP